MATRKIYRTMQGKIVDMEKLAAKNELTPAIGNARVNARGDELGPGGSIVRKREDIMSKYYDQNPDSVPDEKPRRIDPYAEESVKVEKETTTRRTINRQR